MELGTVIDIQDETPSGFYKLGIAISNLRAVMGEIETETGYSPDGWSVGNGMKEQIDALICALSDISE